MAKWSKNQIMRLIGLLFSFVAIIISVTNLYYYIKLSHEQTIVIQQVDEIQSRIGKFEELFVSSLQFTTNKSSIINNLKNSGFTCNATCCWTYGSSGGKSGAC